MAITMPKHSGHQHSCMTRATSRCRVNVPGMPRSKRCPACGSSWLVQTGVFTVQVWRGDGRYSMQTATSAHSTHGGAASVARKGDDLVVRFISTA